MSKNITTTSPWGPNPMSSSHFRRLLMSCSALPIAATFIAAPVLSQSPAIPRAPMQVAQAIQASGPVATIANEDPFQVRFRADTLVLEPVLSVGLLGGGRTAIIGEEVGFQTYSNYPAFIKSSEIRVFKSGQSPDAIPLAKAAIDADGRAVWRAAGNAQDAYYYVYRVAGHDGKFDETAPQELTLVAEKLPDDLDFGTRPKDHVFATVDQTARRTIDMPALMATVTGRADPITDVVRVSGQLVPIDQEGKFSAQQIVPRAGGAMTLVISRRQAEIKRVTQSFSGDGDDWFIVGHGDLTLGKTNHSGPSSNVSGDTLAQGSYAIGRAAFYAKGVTRNDITITAAVDTGEAALADLFTNLDRKDPRQLLRRLNTEQYYPTYGDDSTTVEDAPTQGRFYLKAGRGANQFVVGNFLTQIAGGELVQLDRGLFGALLDLNSQKVTSFGERQARLTTFAASPGTLPGREEFRGTGSSLFFLKRQDISIGSQRLRIEIRDHETGLILESRELHPQQDYDFDPFQGRVMLLNPLASSMASGSVVRESSAAGNVPVLVVRYEYSPPIGSFIGNTIGGRGSAWVGEKVRVGVTGQQTAIEDAQQTLVSVDVLHRIAAGTYAKAEFATSKGPGFGQSSSVDGGLSFSDFNTAGVSTTAHAWRTELALNVAELTQRSGDHGAASAYFESSDRGFSSAGRLSPASTQRWGLAGSRPLGTTGLFSVKYDELVSRDVGTSRTGVFDVSNRYAISGGALTAKAGLRFEDRVAGLLYNSVQTGARTDAAVEVGYAPRGTNWSVHAFGQGTLRHDPTRSRNNRIGIGGTRQVTQRLSLEGEISGGDGGQGADIQLNHRRANGSQSFVGYSLFADRTDGGLDPQNLFTRSNRGTLTVGARQRFSDSLSVTGETRIGMGGIAPSLTRSFGLVFDPTRKLSLGGSFETGKIDDATTGIFRRTAASLTLGYTLENLRIGSAIELRDEKGVGRNQRVWLLRNNLNYGVNRDWRMVGQVNIARADNATLSIQAAEFTDAMLGLAYRPVENEHFNALFRLQYFDDLGPVGQITGSGESQSPKQTSTIISADANYDITQHLSIGAKYGFREGKVSLARGSDDFVDASAHLGVVQLTYDVAKEWEVLLEGRALWVTQARDQRLGALGAIYRHLGNNIKIGIGYSWSDFSDDLTDQSYTSQGPFVNLIGKF